MAKKKNSNPTKTNNPNSEAIASGIQYLMMDVAPITQNDRMTQKCAAPLVAGCEQHPCDIGLFNTIQRNQIDLLDYLSAAPNPKTFQLNPSETQQE